MDDKKQIEFMHLYKPVHSSFVRFCAARSYKIIETEDLVNETVLIAYENFDKLKDKKAFLAYLFGIANNLICNLLRRKKILKYVDEIDESIIDPSSPGAEKKLIINDLYKALNKLPDNQKEAIILFEISGFSINEISEIQKTSVSSVKQRLKRGREKLSEILCTPQLAKESICEKSVVLASIFLF